MPRCAATLLVSVLKASAEGLHTLTRCDCHLQLPARCVAEAATQFSALILLLQSLVSGAAQSMAVYQQYVMGMLTNFDGLPFDRIHNMLKMFATDPPYDKTATELAVFLGQLVTAGKLILEPGGVYRKRVA